jgi:hypothetical protein
MLYTTHIKIGNFTSPGPMSRGASQVTDGTRGIQT